MATAISTARKTALQAESIRRCNGWPSQSYVLAVLAERDGKATFSATYGHGALLQACQQLQEQGWVRRIGAMQENLAGQQVFTCLAA